MHEDSHPAPPARAPAPAGGRGRCAAARERRLLRDRSEVERDAVAGPGAVDEADRHALAGTEQVERAREARPGVRDGLAVERGDRVTRHDPRARGRSVRHVPHDELARADRRRAARLAEAEAEAEATEAR